MEKRWSKTEISHLKKHAASQTVEELAARFHTETSEVVSKMDELHLTAQKSAGSEIDVALKDFEAALDKINKKQWSDAKSLMEKVAAEADTAQMADRARQYIEICSRQEDTLSSDDPYLLAVFEKNRGNLDLALEACQGEKDDKSGRFAYLKASIQALAGEEDEALRLLDEAIGIEPKNRVHAYHDPDFRELQGREEFNDLVSLPSADQA